MNLCIEVSSFIESFFHTQMDVIDSILFSGNLKLRIIFSIKFTLIEGELPIAAQARNYLMPAYYDMPVKTKTQLFNYNKIKPNHSNMPKLNNSLSASILNTSLTPVNLSSTLDKKSFSFAKNRGFKSPNYYRKLIANIILKK